MSLPASPFLSADPPLTAEKAPLATDWNPAASGVDDIAEIFRGADKLNDPQARFVLDEQAFMDAIDEPPLFLRRA